MDARDELLLSAPDRTAQALEYEIAIVGAMLIDDRCIGPTLPEVSENDFIHTEYRHLFAVMRDMFLAGRAVDPVTVAGALGDNSRQLTQLMRQCMEVTPTAANTLDYCRQLREESRKLRRQELGYQLSQEWDGDRQDVIIAQIQALSVDRRDRRAVPLQELLRNFSARMRDKQPPKYLPWGLPTLDRQLYAEPGDLIVLGGHPSSGKTLLSLIFALRQAREYRVGYYSLETSDAKIADRLVAAHAPVALSAIKHKALSAQDWAATAQFIKREADSGFEYVPASGMTVADITAMALSRRHQIVYIDYLQKIRERGEKRFEIVTAISSGLQMLAKSHGIAVVALSQLTRAQKTKAGSWIPPSMSDFRESGQIEQDADIALLLWPEDLNDYQSNRILKIGKNKEGTKTDLKLEFDGLHQLMRELPEDKSREIAAKLSAKGKAAKNAARAKSAEQFSEMTEDDPDMPF